MNAKTAELDASKSKAAEIPADLTLSEAQERYESAMRREALLFADSLATMSEREKLMSADKLARKALKLEVEKPRSILNLMMLASGTVERVRIDSDTPASEPLHLVRESGEAPEADAVSDQ